MTLRSVTGLRCGAAICTETVALLAPDLRRIETRGIFAGNGDARAGLLAAGLRRIHQLARRRSRVVRPFWSTRITSAGLAVRKMRFTGLKPRLAASGRTQ